MIEKRGKDIIREHKFMALHEKDEVWRIEAYFSHLDKPLGFATNMGKLDTYEQLSRWLASENIQRVLVYTNGSLYQTITVSNAPEENNPTTA